MLTERQKLEARLEELTQNEFVGSFICPHCKMYNEYIIAEPTIEDNNIVFVYKCDHCGGVKKYIAKE